MRFAYIDSNGNEVPIPSVDALALRIELGAITEDTELYDAQADEWGPAGNHEIFHTLQRSLAGDEGFVAPPPVSPGADAAEAAPRDDVSGGSDGGEGQEEASGEFDLGGGLELEAAPLELEVELEGSDVGAGDLELALPVESSDDEASGEEGADLGLTLADAPAEEAEAEEASEPVSFDLAMDAIELAPPPGTPPSDATVSPIDLSAPIAFEQPLDPGSEDEPEGETGIGTFDFGDLEGGLEMEDTEEPEPDPEVPMDLGGGVTDASALDMSGGIQLESAMDFGSAGGLDSERPLGDFGSGRVAGGMAPATAESDGDDGMDLSARDDASDGDGDDEGAAAPPESAKASRTPSAPKYKKQRSPAPFVALVVVGVLAAGGYFGWPVISEMLAGSGEPEVPEVQLPGLAAELEPAMDAAVAAAFASIVAAAAEEAGGESPLDRPPVGWLTGRYLAEASAFDGVAEFWIQQEDFGVAVAASGDAEFESALVEALSGAGVAGDDLGAIRARALAGFEEAAADRSAVHARFAGAVGAALDLHDFLVMNEASIEYAPAATETTDPITEANPTPEVRPGMTEALRVMYQALDDLGYDGQVTAPGLQAHLLQLLQGAGVR